VCIMLGQWMEVTGGRDWAKEGLGVLNVHNALVAIGAATFQTQQGIIG